MRHSLSLLCCLAACAVASSAAAAQAAAFSSAEVEKLLVDSAKQLLLKKPQKGTFAVVEGESRARLLVNPPAGLAKDKVLFEGTWSITKGKGGAYTVTKLYRLATGRAESSAAAQVEKLIEEGCGPDAGPIYRATMSDPTLQKAFGVFLKGESNLEPLELILALGRLAEKPSVKDWNQIEVDYIRDHASKEVNLPSTLKKKLLAASAVQKEYRNPENLLKSLKFKDAIADLNRAIEADMMDPVPRFRKQFLGADFSTCKVTPLDPKVEKGLKK